MPRLTPKKTFLLRNEVKEGHKKATDVIAHKGVPIDVTNEEAVKFAGYWNIEGPDGDKEKKKVTDAAKVAKDAKRIV
jgi:hypothetical protein